MPDIEQWHIKATVYKDRVEEVHYISDPARNIRRKAQTRVWHVESFLGRGGFGEVRLERNREEGTVRAVKRITTASPNLSNSECEKELKALLEFSKPKSREAGVFCDFYGWFRDGSEVFLAMEYIPLGDLEHNVSKLSGRLPETEGQIIAGQILEGLEIMHAEGFAHRDLKPQNILVVNGPPQWWIKICDLGLSKQLTDTTAFQTKAGTQSYMAPEMLNYLDDDNDSDEYTNAIDLWAVGCIVYRLLTGKIPFPPGRLLMKYCSDKSLFPLDPLFDYGIKSEGAKFIRELLAPYPEDRPSASEALKHNWIAASAYGGTSPVVLNHGEDSTQNLESSMSVINFNSESHIGLKSYQSTNILESDSSNSQQPPAVESLTLKPPISPVPILTTTIIRKPISSHASPVPTESPKPVEVNLGLSLPDSAPVTTPPAERDTAADLDEETEIIGGSVLSESSEHSSNTTVAYPDPNPGPFLRPGFSFKPGNPVILPNRGENWDLLWSAETRSPYWYNSRTKRKQKLNLKEMGIYLKSRNESVEAPKNPEANPDPSTGVQGPGSSAAHPAYGERPAVQIQGLPTTSPPYTDNPVEQLKPTSSTEVLLCHTCGHQWYKREQGLTCPKCRGEAIEILSVVDSPLANSRTPRRKNRSPFFDNVTGVGLPRKDADHHQEELVRALFNFDFTDVGDLELRKGDVVKVSEKINADWWRGTKVVIDSDNGKQKLLDGIFPKDYVEPFSDKIVRRGRAIFDFYGAAAGDLPFKKDDIIIIREATKSEGWVRGSLDGKQGNVPVNYIREIPMPTTHQVQYENITHVKCLLDNHATSIEELILHKGDVIKLLGPVMDGRCREVIVGGKFKDHLFDPKYNDWWMGSLDYRVGVFSMSFVETINDHRFDAFSLPPRDISRRLRVSIISVGTFKTDTWSGSTLHHPRCEFIMDSRVEFKSNALVSMVGDQFREHFSPSCEESWECDLRERLLFVVQLFARVESPTYSGATEEFYGSVQVQYSASDNTEQRYYFPKGAWVVLRFTTADDSTLSSFQSLESLDPLTISPVKWSKNLSRVPSKSKGLRSRLADMLVKAEDVT